MKSKYQDFGFVFFAHLSLIIIFWLLPFLVNWKLVLLSVLIYYTQRYIWRVSYGLCPLTIVQFKTKDPYASFYHYYLTKYFGLNLYKRKTKFVITWVIPWIIFIISLVWQILFGFKPLII